MKRARAPQIGTRNPARAARDPRGRAGGRGAAQDAAAHCGRSPDSVGAHRVAAPVREVPDVLIVKIRRSPGVGGRAGGGAIAEGARCAGSGRGRGRGNRGSRNRDCRVRSNASTGGGRRRAQPRACRTLSALALQRPAVRTTWARARDDRWLREVEMPDIARSGPGSIATARRDAKKVAIPVRASRRTARGRVAVGRPPRVRGTPRSKPGARRGRKDAVSPLARHGDGPRGFPRQGRAEWASATARLRWCGRGETGAGRRAPRREGLGDTLAARRSLTIALTQDRGGVLRARLLHFNDLPHMLLAAATPALILET